MIAIRFYEVPARDYQAQRRCSLATRVPYRWRVADWHAYRVPKPRHRWQHWGDFAIEPTDDLVREARKRRACNK